MTPVSMHSLIEPTATARQKLFTRSSFCWLEGYPRGRNQFVSFEQKFCLDQIGSAMLHLFADTRYRLWINEKFVAYGPGRFVTAHPEYDSHDITRYLRRGENLIRVEVNYYGISSFQTMPDGLPCFIADGGIVGTDVSFATPGTWVARIHEAWDKQAPLFSFAQNPAEICDTRILAQELACPADHPFGPLPNGAKPWLRLSPRSVPMPDYETVRPPRILVAGPLDDSSLRWGMQMTTTGFNPEADEAIKVFTEFTTWIHSPRLQKVSLDCFWTKLHLNGEPLKIEYPEHSGNHGRAQIELHEGWNFLAGNFQHLLEHWTYLLGLPRDSGATLHAEADLKCSYAFACSPPIAEPAIPDCPSSYATYAIPADWTLRNSSLPKITPARLVAWDRPLESDAVRALSFTQLSQTSPVIARSAVWSFDFQDEYYGHPVVEVEAPAGSILDVAYDDWKRADGCVDLYRSSPFTDAADRFILRGGRQRIEVLNPRGGIFLQVILRAPEGSPPVALRLHDVAIRRRTTLNKIDGSFTCGDTVLDWAWDNAIHTLQASMDEAYSDCPWRERGSYIGDSMVNIHLHRLASADLSVARRTLANFGKAQLPDGQLACCAPSWLTKPHEDFTLIWILAVRDFWAHTGDTSFLTDQWPVIQRIWASPTWKSDVDGLWDTTGMRVFIDWGVLPAEREGSANLVINVLRVAACRACAEMAEAIGRTPGEIDQFYAEADSVAATMEKRLWIESEGRFAASLGAETPALHGNILALRYGVGPAAGILTYLEPKLRANFACARKKGLFSGFAELYFFHYLLPALNANDRNELAEDLIQEHYGFVQSLGYPTLPEAFSRADVGTGSCCHSWSGASAIYATDFVLGMRLAYPGRTDTWLLDPRGSSHPSAEGSLPHPDGPIHVRWKRSGGRIQAYVTAPAGVTILPANHVDITVTAG